MKARLFWVFLLSSIILLLPYSTVYADNCGSLSDCFNGNIVPALLLLLGLILLVAAAWYLWPIIAEISLATLFRTALTNAARVAGSRILVPVIRSAISARLRSATGGVITGLTKHGLGQILYRSGGTGVATRAIADAVKNAIRQIPQAGGKTLYEGKDAVVILNKVGKIITAWAKNSGGWRWFR